MVALYPNIHFALIDNDCLPLTLFEITELWHLADPRVLPLGTKVSTGESAARDVLVVIRVLGLCLLRA